MENKRVCGNCRYWGGVEISNLNNVETNSTERKEMCWGPHGSFKNYKVLSESTCIKWERFNG